MSISTPPATPARAPVALALDAPDLDTALAWAGAAGPHLSTVKVGLELFCRTGPDIAAALRRVSDAELFLDLKLHDIPNTVAGAARAVRTLQPRYLTVHAGGGRDMVRAAVDAVEGTVLITGVTVLTSLSDAALEEVGLTGPTTGAVLRLAALAVEAGAGALVCSPQEVAAVRAEVGPDVVLVTPGVRPAGESSHDQARVATPGQALADGADLLVVGRPITGAVDPGDAAAQLAADLRA